MGFFDRLFGKKPTAPAQSELGEEDDIQPTDSQPIQGPPEFVRAAEMQRAYWTHDPLEQTQLEARSAEQLDWRERLRLHHLICLQRLKTGPERAAATEKCRQTVRGMIAPDSPYRPRPAMVWQGQSAQPGAGREPDIQGEFLNPSLTHLGCLEVYRVDAANQPIRLDFVGFDELSGVVFAPPNLIRAAKLFYEDGRRRGRPRPPAVRFDLGHRQRVRPCGPDDAVRVPFGRRGGRGALGASGVGVGQQDFSVRGHDGGSNLFGLGSVNEISFPLDMRDLRFDAKARARGIDPDEVRRSMGAA